MSSNPFEWFPGSSQKLHCEAAEAIRRNPVRLHDALALLVLWLETGTDARDRLLEWKTILQAALTSGERMSELLALLEDESEEAVHLKSYSPMAGILDRSTIDRVYESCIAPSNR